LIFLIPLAKAEESDGAEEKKAELRDKALQASYDEYKEQVAAWRNLDTKAQGNVTVAGIFIAGIFTYLSKFTLAGLAEAGFLLLALLSLVGCVLLSLFVLRVRDVPPHYLGAFMRWMVKTLKGKTDEAFQRYLPLLYEDHAELWHESYEKFAKKNKHKGDLLWATQLLLIFAIHSRSPYGRRNSSSFSPSFQSRCSSPLSF